MPDVTNLKEQAKQAAARVEPDAVGLDPLTILTILTQVLPLLTACWNRNDEPNPALAASSLKRYYENAPDACRRRTARRIRAEADQPMTKTQSLLLADAVIQQACSLDPLDVEACCIEAGR